MLEMERGRKLLLDKLLESLRSGSESEREDSSHTLFELGLSQPADLIPYLHDDNGKVRENIVRALGTVGDPAAKPYLIEALNDSCWQVQGQSIIALRTIDSSMLGQVLLALEQTPHEWVVFCLLDWMAACDQVVDERCESFLRRVLDNEGYSKEIQSRALAVLTERNKEVGAMHVLIDTEIVEEAKGGLLRPFCDENARGASYDIRVGDTAILIEPEPPKGRGRIYINLEQQGSFRIPPGYSCTLHSLEEVDLPANMLGFLYNRMQWVVHRLNFDGGVVSPGYCGILFITTTNLGDSDIEITYGQPLVSLVLLRLKEPVGRPYSQTDEPRRKLSADRLPPCPLGERYDAIELSRRIDEIDSRCRVRAPMVDATNRIVDSVILGGLAGLIAGAVVVLIPAVQFPWNVIIAAAAVLLGVIGLVWRRKRV